MKLVLFTIRDNVAEVFNKPFTDLNAASAIRSFTLSLKDEPQKQDYTLYQIGTMDQVNGQITAGEPISIMTGFDVIKEDEKNQPAHLVKQAI